MDVKLGNKMVNKLFRENRKNIAIIFNLISINKILIFTLKKIDTNSTNMLI